MSVEACELTQKKCKPCEGGVDPLTRDEAENLLQQTPDWIISNDGIRIRKDWKVKNFMAAMDFFNKASEIAEDEGHHPDFHLVGYRNMSVELWTHAIGGLSENDFIVAAKIDQLPVEMQEA
tara:strand:+ start:199 stop:561 length:363 start_codon:yes stop_codon:yes gene_type:complete